MLDFGLFKRWCGDLLSTPETAANHPPPSFAPSSAPLAAADERALAWPQARLDLAEQLWGEGFVMPGGSAEIAHLINPISLTAADTLLLLGAGPFGAARTIIAARKCWVEGYERDPELLASALRRAELAGQKKRAPALLLDQATKYRPKSASHALALNAIGDSAAVKSVLGGMMLAMRSGGQAGIIETVATGDLSDPLGRRWLALEKREAPPPSQLAINAELRRLAFDVRIAEDISPRHLQAVLTGWTGVLERLSAAGRPTAGRARLVVAEAELWMLRLRLIQTGRLRMMRWLAIKP